MRKKEFACCMLAFNAILRIRRVVPRALFGRLCQKPKKKHKGKQKDSQRDTQHIVTQTHTCARELCMLVCAKICKLSVATFVLAVFWCRKRKKQQKLYVYTLFGLAIVESKAPKKTSIRPVVQSVSPQYVCMCECLRVCLCLPVSVCRSSLLSPLCSLPLSSPLLFCFVSGSTRQHFYTFMLLAFN